MKIGKKLFLGAAALTLLPLALTAGLEWQAAISVADATLSRQTETQLVSLRDLKSQQIKDELDSRLAALKSLGQNRSTVEAMKGFKTSFYTAAADVPRAAAEAPAQRAAMLEFVETQFAPEFSRRNPGKAPELAALVDARDPNTVALQHQYIVANSNKLGEKEKMVSAGSAFPYNEMHAQVHPTLERAQKLFGFYDIFLIDTATDQVVYTVFKELDFGTRLGDGIAAKTKLAEAYQRVKNAKSRDDIYLSDFEPYLASYNDQAAFAAVPVFDGERQIGVLAMQYPIDKITATINSNKTWASIGLGQTGDAYLVGPDKMLRTDVRDLLTRKTDFLRSMGERLNPQTRTLVDKKNSSIGAVSGDSLAAQEALAGRSGVMRFVDYRGVPMLGAFAPLAVGGLNWAVVTNVAQEEADAPVQALNSAILWRASAVAVGALLLVGALIAFFLRGFMRPITRLHGAVSAVAGGDTAARSRLTEADEVGDLGRAFDKLLDERIAQLEQAKAENEQLNNSVIALLQTVFQLSNKDLTVRADVTEDVIGTLSSSINQLSDATGRTLHEVREIANEVQLASESVSQRAGQVDATARDERQSLDAMAANLTIASKQLTQVAQLSDHSNKTAEQVSSITQTALRSVTATVRGMDQLRESISETEKRFKRLGERSQEISSVVSMINSISERTHVLALNASMQAATAGEAGRGFAVVAEEVQRLSESSRQSTQQISQLVQNIQLETNETIFTMNRLISQVVTQSEQAQQAGEQMAKTQEVTADLVALVRQIADFSEQQSSMSRELQQSVTKLNQGSDATVDAISQQTESTQSLVHSSRRLLEAVSQFTLPQAA